MPTLCEEPHQFNGECRVHGSVCPGAEDVSEKVVAYVEYLEECYEENHSLISKMSEILSRTAEALKGPPPSNTWHDWSDLPDVAMSLVKSRDMLGRMVADYEAKYKALRVLCDKHVIDISGTLDEDQV